MIVEGSGVLVVAINLTLALMVTALAVVMIRMMRGPSLPDRVVSLDLTAVVVVGIIAVYSITTEQPVFLDASLVLALIAFLGTVAFARYVERRELP